MDEDKPVEEEVIEQTAPVLPWEIVIHSCQTFLQKLPNGGMSLKFCPSAGPGAIMVPAFDVEFDKGGWERFQRDVADGHIHPQIQTAQGVPLLG